MPGETKWCRNISRKERKLKDAINKMDWSKVSNDRLDAIIEHLRNVRRIKQFNQVYFYQDGEECQLYPKKIYPNLEYSESEYESDVSDQEIQSSNDTNFSPTPPNLSFNSVISPTQSFNLSTSYHGSAAGVSPPRDSKIKIRLMSENEFRSGTISPDTFSITSSERELSPNHIFPEPHKRIRIESPTNFIIRSDSEDDMPRTSTPIPSKRIRPDDSGKIPNIKTENSRTGFQHSGVQGIQHSGVLSQHSEGPTFRPNDVVHVKPTPDDSNDFVEESDDEFDIKTWKNKEIKKEEN